MVDFYANTNKDDRELIADCVYGRQRDSRTGGTLTGTSGALHGSDSVIGTMAETDQNGRRIVAKVSAKIKCHIPYETKLMRLMCAKRNSAAVDNHYSMLRWDSDNDRPTNSDAIWYTCSTYYSTSR